MLRRARSRRRSSRLVPSRLAVTQTSARERFRIGFLAARENFGIFDGRPRIILVERVHMHLRVCACHSTAVLVKRAHVWLADSLESDSSAFRDGIAKRFDVSASCVSCKHSSSSIRRCRSCVSSFWWVWRMIRGLPSKIPKFSRAAKNPIRKRSRALVWVTASLEGTRRDERRLERARLSTPAIFYYFIIYFGIFYYLLWNILLFTLEYFYFPKSAGYSKTGQNKSHWL